MSTDSIRALQAAARDHAVLLARGDSLIALPVRKPTGKWHADLWNRIVNWFNRAVVWIQKRDYSEDMKCVCAAFDALQTRKNPEFTVAVAAINDSHPNYQGLLFRYTEPIPKEPVQDQKPKYQLLSEEEEIERIKALLDDFNSPMPKTTDDKKPWFATTEDRIRGCVA